MSDNDDDSSQIFVVTGYDDSYGSSDEYPKEAYRSRERAEQALEESYGSGRVIQLTLHE